MQPTSDDELKEYKRFYEGYGKKFTTLYSGIELTGDIEIQTEEKHNLKVCCLIYGNIICKGLVFITKDAKIHGDIIAAAIIIEGEVTGDLTASDKIELRKSAKVKGNCKTAHFARDESCDFSGFVDESDQSTDFVIFEEKRDDYDLVIE
ncbi:polymer-forming cytoskeletal protein [candidate division KSB1 bacterium]|nr:polymer-forming cytoskeletal protein [candidate division KSB1 bacterium]